MFHLFLVDDDHPSLTKMVTYSSFTSVMTFLPLQLLLIIFTFLCAFGLLFEPEASDNVATHFLHFS